MKKAAKKVTAIAALVVILAALYRFGLSDEARENVRKTAGSVRDAYRKLDELVSKDENKTDPEDLPNRRATAAQWEVLGY